MTRERQLLIAKSVLESSIKGLNALNDVINNELFELIEKILSIKGKVIVSGIGKSGHIARKISSTLSSTGTSSFFLHPAEASHGDLGMIDDNDLVLLLSNSGETQELKDIVNYAKRYHIALACFVRNEKSSLAKASNYPIILPKSEEALGFAAPTTSTTMMLVLGDMLAMTLLNLKNFTRDDFQKYHPGGRLGASFLKVKDIMHSINDTPLVKLGTSMLDALEVINKYKLGCVMIVNELHKIVGIITDGVIRNKLHMNVLEKKVEDIMTINPVSIKDTSLVVEAIDLMNSKSITNLPVIDSDNLIVGAIHMHDCLRSGANSKI